MTRPRSKRRYGFTLVEVLAALVLMGVALPITLRAMTLATRAAAHARHLTEAGQLADLKLGELRLLTDTTDYSGAGEFTDQPEYKWEATSRFYDAGCYEVTVRVIWQEQGTPRDYALSTLIYPTLGQQEDAQ